MISASSPPAVWVRREACPVCSAGDRAILFAIAESNLCRCRRCGMQYLDPCLNEKEMARFHRLCGEEQPANPLLADYHRVTLKDAAPSRTLWIYRRVLDLMERHKSKGALLDLGCGTGSFLALARERGWKGTGLDADADVVRYARDEFGLDVRHGRFEEFTFEHGAFDAITMWDYFEHMLNPVETLKRCFTLLQPGGLIVIATPDVDGLLAVLVRWLHAVTASRLRWPLETVYVPSHPLCFSANTLRRLVVRCRFEPVVSLGDETDLRRLSMHPMVKAGVRGLFVVARFVGRPNRTILIARKPSGLAR